MENCIVTQSRLLIKQWSFGFIESSPLTRSMKNYFGFLHASSFPLHEGQLFYWSIMTAVDNIKYWCAHSGMTDQVGGFQNPGVCLQAFPSFLPHPLSALLLVPFFARSLTLVSRSLLLNCTETLAVTSIFNHKLNKIWMYFPLWLVSLAAFIKWAIVFKWTYKNANCLEYINKNPDIELIGEFRARAKRTRT